MTDGGAVDTPEVAEAKAQMIEALQRAQACLSDALAAQDRIPTNQSKFFERMHNESTRIYYKTLDLLITYPNKALYSLERSSPYTRCLVFPFSNTCTGLDQVEDSLGKMIDFVFDSAPHPDETGSKQTMLSQLDPVLFIFMAFVRFPDRWEAPGGPGDGVQVCADECEVRYLPHWIRIAKEYLENHREETGGRWIFEKNFQITIAKRAHLKSFADFRKAYHKLEFQLDTPEPEKIRTELTTSPSGYSMFSILRDEESASKNGENPPANKRNRSGVSVQSSRKRPRPTRRGILDGWDPNVSDESD
ncbi:hypothetical protein V8F20_004780 [Naviculisporaceae sp. PSN 640]